MGNGKDKNFNIYRLISTLLFGLKDNEMDVTAAFKYSTGPDENIFFDDDDATILFIPSSGVGYNSNSGTVKVILGERTNIFVGVGAFTAVKVEFEESFGYSDASDEFATATVSGYFIANLPEEGL